MVLISLETSCHSVLPLTTIRAETFGAHDWSYVIVLSFKGDACRARLIKEIEMFVRNKELS